MIRRLVLLIALALPLAACQAITNTIKYGTPDDPAVGQPAAGALAHDRARLTFVRQAEGPYASYTPVVVLNRTTLASLAPGARHSQDVLAGAVRFNVGVPGANGHTFTTVQAEAGTEYVYDIVAIEGSLQALQSLVTNSVTFGLIVGIKGGRAPSAPPPPAPAPRYEVALKETTRHPAF